MSFLTLFAKNIDVYYGLGMGVAGLKRSFIDIEQNGDGQEKTLKSEENAQWTNGFSIRMLFGATYTFYKNYFTGLEGYVGHQFLENIFLKAELFGGGKALVGINLPYKMKVHLGFGIDIGHHISKKTYL